ncbi:MAG: hypothetical protein O0X93_04210 [Methanocorpusculum sp.]|nr:hypothetical protein [Methanocorpusculum sp.]MDE2524047.1 hypothetical protein [Methanocorpusculum sp.]
MFADLVKSELFKLQKLRTFKILFVLIAVNALLTIAVASATRDFWAALGMPDVFSGINLYYAALGDTIVMVLAGSVLAGIFLCSDFENKTLQAAISSGYSRFSVITAKTLVYFLALAVLLLPVAIITAVALLFLPEFGMVFTPEILVHMAAVFVVMILVYAASLSICVPFAFALKRSSAVTALSLIVLFLAVTLFSSIGQFVPWIGTVLSWLPFTLPSTVLVSGVLPFDLLRAAGICVGFILLMTAAACGVFRRADLK